MQRRTSRLAALALALPLAGIAFHATAAEAETAHCLGHRVTMVVTAHSPHTVKGTSKRDVIEVLAAGHVIKAGKGADLVCGSAGRDVIVGGAGADPVSGGGGDGTDRR